MAIAQSQNEILSLALSGANLYWMDMGELGMVPRTGGASSVLANTPSPLFALGGYVTANDTEVYWANGNFPNGAVNSVPTQGGASTQIAATDEPIGIAVDAHNIYWSTFGSSNNPVGTIVRRPLAGGATITLASGLSTVGPIAIDADDVYWTDCLGSVASVPIAGGSVRTLLTAQYNVPLNTELDETPAGIAVSDGRIYWTSTPLAGGGPSLISSMSVDGGAVTVLASPVTRPSGIAVDADDVYWLEIGPATAQPGGGLGSPPIVDQGTLNRISKNGGDSVVIANGASYPYGPVVDDEAVYYTSGGGASTIYRLAK